MLHLSLEEASRKYCCRPNALAGSTCTGSTCMAWVEDGSFGIFKVTFADEKPKVFFDYPTDLSEEEAEHLARKVLQPIRFCADNPYQ